MFKQYQRLLNAYLLASELQNACIKAAESWAELCRNQPNESDIYTCFQDSLERMKRACDHSKIARENLDNFVRENLKA